MHLEQLTLGVKGHYEGEKTTGQEAEETEAGNPGLSQNWDAWLERRAVAPGASVLKEGRPEPAGHIGSLWMRKQASSIA